jgi:hypothetical protein
MFHVVLANVADSNMKTQDLTLIDYRMLWALRLSETLVWLPVTVYVSNGPQFYGFKT